VVLCDDIGTFPGHPSLPVLEIMFKAFRTMSFCAFGKKMSARLVNPR
jgi:hypothetical protein